MWLMRPNNLLEPERFQASPSTLGYLWITKRWVFATGYYARVYS